MARLSNSRTEGRPWYRDGAARRCVLRGYLPWLAVLELAWEIAQLPLYTIWREAAPAYIAFAVLHCTLGDLLIGSAALALALLVTRAGPLESWRWLRIGIAATLVGATYTLLSEWINTAVRASWAYSALMPTLELHGMVIGLAPLMQWLIVPPAALYLARLSTRR